MDAGEHGALTARFGDSRTSNLREWTEIAEGIVMRHEADLASAIHELEASGALAVALVGQETLCRGMRAVRACEKADFPAWSSVLVVDTKTARPVSLSKWLRPALRDVLRRHHTLAVADAGRREDGSGLEDDVLLLSREELASVDPQLALHSSSEIASSMAFPFLDSSVSDLGLSDATTTRPRCIRLILDALGTHDLGDGDRHGRYSVDVLARLHACRAFVPALGLFPLLSVLDVVLDVAQGQSMDQITLREPGLAAAHPAASATALADAVVALTAANIVPVDTTQDPVLILGEVLGRAVRQTLSGEICRDAGTASGARGDARSADRESTRGTKRARAEPTAGANGDVLLGSDADAGSVSLDGHIKFLELIETSLRSNDRRTRDWTALDRACREFPECYTKHVKQKTKRVLQERRDRKQLRFWTRVKKTEGEMDKILPMVREMVGDYHPAMDDRFIEILSSHLGSLATASKKSPGNLLEWNEPARREVTAKMVELHLEYYPGRPFHHVQSHFQELFSLADIELGILASCTCSECTEDWNLDDSIRSNETLLRLHWSREKAALLRRILELHRDHRSQIYQHFDGSEKKLRNWTKEDVDYVLQLAHPMDECPICLEARKHGEISP